MTSLDPALRNAARVRVDQHGKQRQAELTREAWQAAAPVIVRDFTNITTAELTEAKPTKVASWVTVTRSPMPPAEKLTAMEAALAAIRPSVVETRVVSTVAQPSSCRTRTGRKLWRSSIVPLAVTSWFIKG